MVLKNKEVFDLLLDRESITTKDLNELGYYPKKINDLIKMRILKRVKRGCYVAASNDILEEYKKYLEESTIKNNMFTENYFANRDLFLEALKSFDETKILNSFERLRKSVLTDREKRDVNFYMILLNQLYVLEEKDLLRLKSFVISDFNISSGDERFKVRKRERKLRVQIFENNISFAFNNFNSCNCNDNVHMEITRILLYRCNSKVDEIVNKEKQLVEMGNFQELYDMLFGRKHRRILSNIDNHVYNLVRKYLIIEKRGKNLPVTEIEGEKFSFLIYHNNFRKAYDELLRVCQNDGRDVEKYAVASMLRKLIKMVDKLENGEKAATEKTSDKSDIDLATAIDAIYDENLEIVYQYLEILGKNDYFDLMTELVKLAKIEEDKNYTEAIMTLVQLHRGTYLFDPDRYDVAQFEGLNTKDYNRKMAYINIQNSMLSPLEKQKREDMLTLALNDSEALQEFVETGAVEMEKYSNDSSLIQEDKEKVVKDNVTSSDVLIDYQEDEKVVDDDLDDTAEKYPHDYDEELVEQKVDELYAGKSIVILDPMDNEQRKHIHQIVSKYYDVVSFSIGRGHERSVVLRFKPYFDSKVNERIEQIERKTKIESAPILLNEAKNRQRIGDYEGALKCFRRLIEYGTPYESIYARTGACLLKLGKKHEAVDYLRVATELSKRNNTNIDFTRVIDRIILGDDLDDKKPNFEMRLDDFEDKTAFGIDFNNLDALVALTSEDGFSLEEAITRMGLDLDLADTARLIYARDCYYLERYDEGDFYLRKVANRKKKGSAVMKLMEEVRTDKRFYKNRLDSEKKCLVLKKG